jgi:DHA2 family methylenomycin A resistance protein-like MFS transporter
MSAVDNRRSGIAAGVLNASRQTGAALGVALSGTLIALNHSIARGMHVSVHAAGWLSIVAAVVWWRASKPTACIDSMRAENN